MARWRPVVGLAVLLAGCAAAPVEQAAQPTAGGEQQIRIKALRFTFAPDVVTVRAGVPLTITAWSRSRLRHDLTILTPDGRLLESEDLPAGRTVTIRTVLPEPGRYVFYCSVWLHRRPFGMEGVLIAQ